MPKNDEQPAVDLIDQELKQVQLETARLQLEEQRERNQTTIASKAEKTRLNKERQKQLRAEVLTRHQVSMRCKHRQGGSAKNPLNGKGPTALNIVAMPDGFTKLIMCSVCRLRVFTPHPRDKSKKARPDETAAQAKNRVERYEAAMEYYEELLDKAKDSLTEDAAQEMDCGTTIVFRDDEGREVLPIRPCDTYPNPQSYA